LGKAGELESNDKELESLVRCSTGRVSQDGEISLKPSLEKDQGRRSSECQRLQKDKDRSRIKNADFIGQMRMQLVIMNKDSVECGTRNQISMN
jgi:hypothetical protein